MSFFSDVERELVVRRRVEETPGIVSLTLAAANGRPLPAWEPGAHIDLVLEDGLERQYSLSADPEDRDIWRVAILREDAGRGGSRAAHALAEGAVVRARGPRSNFAFDAPGSGERAVFVAGGIGITPILPMVRSADRAGAEWTLHYSVRTRAAVPFAAEIAALGDRVRLHVSAEGDRADPAAIVAEAGSAPIWACGPDPLLAALAAAGPARLHVEPFAVAPAEPERAAEAFEVELMSTGEVIDVPADRSILETLEDRGVFTVSSCREGTCGTCETVVVEGEVDHRDRVLSAAERETSPVMMICVSRAACPRLVLDV
ncbi:PDR/VanB family oxidoreductase [Microbacterium sp. ZXX196]|uniref:PDR/VanB family oxidoreductase n=1 Tax=Microbacterium sp. ZXX196 TaxID=2609291 RepID=UPI0012BA0C71|nr:PDR/VanB family oxidoreductase [Microbacterium sp. ZXX196]MTE23390.1 2Fe-2S iron-sulfur cluster binding domain-containing protein [Microbacterium sp. ZXX196]